MNTTTSTKGGRPQTYLGALEDNIVEAKALAYELTLHDVREWASTGSLESILQEAARANDDGHVADVRHHLARARALVIQMRVADIEENRKHRSLVAIGRDSGVPA